MRIISYFMGQIPAQNSPEMVTDFMRFCFATLNSVRNLSPGISASRDRANYPQRQSMGLHPPDPFTLQIISTAKAGGEEFFFGETGGVALRQILTDDISFEVNLIPHPLLTERSLSSGGRDKINADPIIAQC